jgi:hypothetical protein
MAGFLVCLIERHDALGEPSTSGPLSALKEMGKPPIYALLLCTAFTLPIAIVSRFPKPATSLNPSYVFLQSWGSEIGVFHYPSGIAVTGNRVYVCDTHSDRVQAFDPYGSP